MCIPIELPAKVMAIESILIARATGDEPSNVRYAALREELLAERRLKAPLPQLVSACRTLDEFSSLIRSECEESSERRTYILKEFDEVLRQLEWDAMTMVPQVGIFRPVGLGALNWKLARASWAARQARNFDYTLKAARQIVKTVCKHILNDFHVTYDKRLELPKLYDLTVAELHVSPNKNVAMFVQNYGDSTSAMMTMIEVVREEAAAKHRANDDAEKLEFPRDRMEAICAYEALFWAGTISAFLLLSWEKQ